MLLLTVLLGVAVVLLSTPAASWLEKAPASLQILEQKLHPLKAPLARVSAATAEMEKIAESSPEAKKTEVVEVKRSRLSEFVLNQTPDFLAAAVTTFILLFFLLASDGLFLRKLIKVIPRLEDKRRTVEIAREIEGSISRYLGTVTLINLGLGAVVAMATWMLDLPNPLLWGTMVACLHFVPYLGAIVGLTAMTLASVLSFDSLGWAMLSPGIYLALAIIEGNFITPFVLGRSLTLNPIVVLIGLIFWGWIWGILGTVLAVPILATFKILCNHIKPLDGVGAFLSE
jgi:predicted PurR-regulated permease PerM